MNRSFNHFISCLLIILVAGCNNSASKEEGSNNSRITKTEEGKIKYARNGGTFKNKKTKELVSKGNKLVNKEEFKKARKLFKQALQVEPGHPDVLNSLGLLEMDAHNLDKAISYFQNALKPDSCYKDGVPKNAALSLSLAYYYNKNYTKSIEISRYIINQLDKKELTNKYQITHGAAHLHLTLAHLKLNQCNKAEKTFKSAYKHLNAIQESHTQLSEIKKMVKKCKD